MHHQGEGAAGARVRLEFAFLFRRRAEEVVACLVLGLSLLSPWARAAGRARAVGLAVGVASRAGGGQTMACQDHSQRQSLRPAFFCEWRFLFLRRCSFPFRMRFRTRRCTSAEGGGGRCAATATISRSFVSASSRLRACERLLSEVTESSPSLLMRCAWCSSSSSCGAGQRCGPQSRQRAVRAWGLVAGTCWGRWGSP